MTAEAHPEEDLVPVSFGFQVLDREIRIRVDPAGVLSPDGVDPTMDRGIGIFAGSVVFGVRSEEPQLRRLLASVETGIPSEHELDVLLLLRHRPRSISLWPASALDL